jgi:magnesium chelatase subunit I
MKRQQDATPYQKIVNWFGDGNNLDVMTDITQKDYEATLNKVPGLREIVKKYHPDADKETTVLFMEFVLFGLAEFSFLSKYQLEEGIQFKDLISSMLSVSEEDDDDLDSDNYQ